MSDAISFREITMKSGKTFVVIVCALMMVVGCGGSDGSVDPVDLLTHVDKGWDAYESGNFAGAKSEFEQAIADNSMDGAAYNGLGWTNMQLSDLQGAVTSFDAALANDFAGADPYAGKAVVLRDIEPVDYEGTITSAKAALGINPNFTFAHDTSLDWKDLRLIVAQAHFSLGQYVQASAQVSMLGGTAPNPTSPTFVEDLLSEIERLGQIIDG